jgi:hypothetical protein
MRALILLTTVLWALPVLAQDYQVAVLDDGTYCAPGENVPIFSVSARLYRGKNSDGVEESCIQEGGGEGNSVCLWGDLPLFKELHTMAVEDLPAGAVMFAGEHAGGLPPRHADVTKAKEIKEAEEMPKPKPKRGTPVGVIGAGAAAGALALAAAGRAVVNRRKP